MKTSNYVKDLGLQHEPGIQHDAHECLLQLLANFTPILVMTVCLRLIN